MNKIVVTVVVLALGWYGYREYQSYEHEQVSGVSVVSAENQNDVKTKTPANKSRFKCDGRTHCSEMTSCAEAKFFINNCPGTKMDGDNDRIPCESQWCN